jgi:hypothetical protein
MSEALTDYRRLFIPEGGYVDTVLYETDWINPDSTVKLWRLDLQPNGTYLYQEWSSYTGMSNTRISLTNDEQVVGFFKILFPDMDLNKTIKNKIQSRITREKESLIRNQKDMEKRVRELNSYKEYDSD